MNNDIVERLKANDADVCWGCGEWGCSYGECTCDCHEAQRLISEAADEIQRLRKRNNYLREELNATDYRKRELLETINKLQTQLDLIREKQP